MNDIREVFTPIRTKINGGDIFKNLYRLNNKVYSYERYKKDIILDYNEEIFRLKKKFGIAEGVDTVRINKLGDLISDTKFKDYTITIDGEGIVYLERERAIEYRDNK